MNRIFHPWKSGAGPEIARAASYFAEDRKAIILLLALTSLSTLIGIIQAWPLAVLIDSLVAPAAEKTWAHRLFLAALPHSPLGQTRRRAADAR